MRKLLVLLTASAATLVLGATPAAAGTVTVDYHCATGGGIVAWDVQYRTTITAPATVAQGQTATVTVEYTGVKDWTTHSPAGTYSGWGSFKLGGAATGTVTAPGLTNPAVQPGEKMRFTGASAQVNFPAKGQVTYTPATFNYGPNCIVWSPAGVAATTTVV